jgi:hypothetical protein
MVLYHANGRVVKAHEDYLEKEAAKHAALEDIRYEEQINVCKRHDPNADQVPRRTYIVVELRHGARPILKTPGRFESNWIMPRLKNRQEYQMRVFTERLL